MSAPGALQLLRPSSGKPTLACFAQQLSSSAREAVALAPSIAESVVSAAGGDVLRTATGASAAESVVSTADGGTLRTALGSACGLSVDFCLLALVCAVCYSFAECVVCPTDVGLLRAAALGSSLR